MKSGEQRQIVGQYIYNYKAGKVIRAEGRHKLRFFPLWTKGAGRLCPLAPTVWPSNYLSEYPSGAFSTNASLPKD